VLGFINLSVLFSAHCTDLIRTLPAIRRTALVAYKGTVILIIKYYIYYFNNFN